MTLKKLWDKGDFSGHLDTKRKDLDGWEKLLRKISIPYLNSHSELIFFIFLSHTDHVRKGDWIITWTSDPINMGKEIAGQLLKEARDKEIRFPYAEASVTRWSMCFLDF